MILKPKIAPYITEIISELQNAGFEAYIVGGAVRDFLLDRQPKDYDLSTSATPEQIKKVFRKQHVMIIGRRFRLVHYYYKGEIIEISTFRRKPVNACPDGRPAKAANAPENMIFSDNEFGTAQEDAERRDFTVNALFYDPVNDKIRDFTGMGENDIRSGIVRAIGDPEVRFEEDPVRILRALKLAGQYSFRIEERTCAAIEKCMQLIQLASDSRMTLELEKILKNPYGDRILETFRQYGFLRYFLPQLDLKWDSPSGQFARNLWRLRNERVIAGEYRESISIAMSILAVPYAQKHMQSPGDSSDLRDDLEDRISFLLKPRTPSRRAISAAVRTLLLQPKLDAADEAAQKRILQHPGYGHARELAIVRSLAQSGSAEQVENFWPKASKHFQLRRPNPVNRRKEKNQGEQQRPEQQRPEQQDSQI